jgi:hypothetical protein
MNTRNESDVEDDQKPTATHFHFCSSGFLDGGNAAYIESTTIKIPKSAKHHPAAGLEKHLKGGGDNVERVVMSVPPDIGEVTMMSFKEIMKGAKETTLLQEAQKEFKEFYRDGDPFAAERDREWSLLANQVVGHETCFP